MAGSEVKVTKLLRFTIGALFALGLLASSGAGAHAHPAASVSGYNCKKGLFYDGYYHKEKECEYLVDIEGNHTLVLDRINDFQVQVSRAHSDSLDDSGYWNFRDRQGRTVNMYIFFWAQAQNLNARRGHQMSIGYDSFALYGTKKDTAPYSMLNTTWGCAGKVNPFACRPEDSSGSQFCCRSGQHKHLGYKKKTAGWLEFEAYIQYPRRPQTYMLWWVWGGHKLAPLYAVKIG